MMKATAISPANCDRLRHWLQRVSGILVPNDRNYLFKERLSVLAKDLRDEYPEVVDDLDALASFILTSEQGTPIVDMMISAMTTNESTWFRDIHPFEALRTEILPVAARHTRRIWSAASSYGQEIYSLAILLEEERAWSGGASQWHLFGTDIDEAALERALAAVYRKHEISRGLSDARCAANFDQVDDLYVLRSHLRQAVKFQRRSLLGTWPVEPYWDVILCRNVLIYFSVEDRLRVLQNLADRLTPGGVLLLGAMEIYPDGVPGLERKRLGATSYWQKVR